MASEQPDALEWKKTGSTKEWDELCAKLTEMINSIPTEVAGEFALITRKPEEPAAKGVVVNATTFLGVMQELLDPGKDEFSAKWFKAYDKTVGLLITKLVGDDRGAHYLIGPNKFPEELRNQLNFLRSMEKASDNLGST